MHVAAEPLPHRGGVETVCVESSPHLLSHLDLISPSLYVREPPKPYLHLLTGPR